MLTALRIALVTTGASLASLLLGCGASTCVRALQCVERCGGPVLSAGCSCPLGTFDRIRCIDASQLDAGPSLDTRAVLVDAGAECIDNRGCGLRPATCCGQCGAATQDDFVAAPVAELTMLGASICEAEGNPGCPECDRPDDPYLAAVCESGACVGLDLREQPLTECAAPTDCVLAARRCCACGVIPELEAIAYNPARGDLNQIVCGADVLCEDPCVPTFASGLAPGCVAGRCVVFGPD